jgi:alkaline phosphatase D
VRWGKTLELFVLDGRGERRPSTRNSPAAEYLSRAQLDWLKRGLLESDAVFKLIMNSVPISDFPHLFDVLTVDRWEGYPAQREELLGFIDEMAIDGVVWVAGDFHLASMGRVAASGAGSTQLEVLVGPGGQNGNVLAGTLGPPQFDWSSRENNYTELALDPERRTVDVRYHDGGGRLLATRTYTV